MRFEVGINPQSLSYGFLNEIMDNLCSDRVLRSDGIGCTKFNEGCTKHSKVGSTPNHILMGSKMKSWTLHIQMGVPKTIGSDIPYLIKNVSNFVQDVPTVPKYVPRWGSAPNHFLMGC